MSHRTSCRGAVAELCGGRADASLSQLAGGRRGGPGGAARRDSTMGLQGHGWLVGQWRRAHLRRTQCLLLLTAHRLHQAARAQLREEVGRAKVATAPQLDVQLAGSAGAPDIELTAPPEVEQAARCLPAVGAATPVRGACTHVSDLRARHVDATAARVVVARVVRDGGRAALRRCRA
mgnify:CR=1 FL=1